MTSDLHGLQEDVCFRESSTSTKKTGKHERLSNSLDALSAKELTGKSRQTFFFFFLRGLLGAFFPDELHTAGNREVGEDTMAAALSSHSAEEL